MNIKKNESHGIDICDNGMLDKKWKKNPIVVYDSYK